VDDLEGTGIDVVDARLLGRQRVLDDLVLDAVVGEGAGGVEAERAKITGEDLHRRHAAGLDRRHELGACREGEVVAAPQAEALGVGEVLDGGGAGRRDVEHAGIRQRVLDTKPGAALLGGRVLAAFALGAGCVLHGVALVEDDDPVEVTSNQSTIWRTRETFSSRASDRSVA